MIRRKRLFVALLGALMFAGGAARAAGVDMQNAFDEANKAYEKGDFDDALQRYTALSARGFGGLALCYNLGNVHFKRGERGQAVLWYERAARIAPRDADVRFNLALARSHIKSEGENPFLTMLRYFSTNELAASTAVLSAVFFVTLGLVALGFLQGDTLPAMCLSISGALLVVAGAWLGGAVYLDLQPVAVVVSPPGEVRNGPGTDYAVGFTVPDGSEVVVLNRRPEWSQVGVPDQGLKGWMPTTEIELVSPRGSF